MNNEYFHIPFIFLAIVTIIALLVGYIVRSRREERAQMIEKGMNPFRGTDIAEFNRLTNLKNGILLLSLGLGLFIGHMLTLSFDQWDGFITYLASALIFGGIGFIISYQLIKRY